MRFEAWSLLLIVLGAALLPVLARRIRLPAVVLEIAFGMLLGKSALDLGVAGDWLPFLAELGFLLLMFQAGMELDFGAMAEQSGGQLTFQFVIFGVTFGLAIGAAVWLGQGMFTALVLTTTSLGLVVPSLKEAGISRTRHGQAILIAATLADFLTLMAITFFVLWHEHGLSWRFAAPLPLFVGFAVLLRLGRLWVWWHPDKAARILGDHDSQEMGVRLSLALLFLLVALSELVHLEPVLGAFMGGALLAFMFRDRHQLETKLSGMAYGFFIPLFFINVGMGFDIRNILSADQLVLTGELLVLAVAVKVVPGLLFTLTGIKLRDALGAGVLLSSRLSLIVAAASIGLAGGFITESFKDAIVLLAVLTCLLGPSLFKAMQPRPSARSGAKPTV